MGQYKSPFGISAYLQETLTYLGQKEVYAEASATLYHLTSLQVCAKQIERVCHHWGARCDQIAMDALQANTTYVMVDGSMILTREQEDNRYKWKEMKLARIFSERDRLELTENRRCLVGSSYVAHFGGSDVFFEKLAPLLAHQESPVVLADGAPWIWNQVRVRWPEAIEILDFYHASESLHSFANEATACFANHESREQWVDEQIEALLNDGVIGVIGRIKEFKCPCARSREAQRKIVGYYETNWGRMRYLTFRRAGYMIGSGAIESAHRHVIQQRMKLAGQRWSIEGGQRMANLRAVYSSGKWTELTSLIKQAA